MIVSDVALFEEKKTVQTRWRQQGGVELAEEKPWMMTSGAVRSRKAEMSSGKHEVVHYFSRDVHDGLSSGGRLPTVVGMESGTSLRGEERWGGMGGNLARLRGDGEKGDPDPSMSASSTSDEQHGEVEEGVEETKGQPLEHCK